jgi:glycosyltransferase involved in cell wall biosynthesis
MSNVTIYTVTYNEELILQLMINHYRYRFPNCHIVIYDNQSTDNTVTIAKANCCEIRHYDSGGQVNDQMLLDTKENCWKDAKTDWVLVCDTDELLDITEEELKYEESLGTTKIKSECWHMVNMKDNLDVNSIHYGFRDKNDSWRASLYDKDLLFNKKHITKIGYEGGGCHSTNSQGKIVNSSKKYKLYHYKYVNPDLFVEKQKISAQRLSEVNKKYGWGSQCLRDESLLRDEFAKIRAGAEKLFEEKKFIPHFYYNIQGWFDFGNLYYYVINSLPRDSHIVEVGAWKGKSSAFLAVEAINSGKNIK